MDFVTVINFIRDFLLTLMSLLTMMSPAFGGPGAAYQAKNADQLVMSMAVVSDIHVETNNPDAYENYEDLLYGIKGGEDIDAAAYLGDNVMNGQIAEDVFFYAGLIGVKPAKQNLVVVGNHDQGNGDGDVAKLSENFVKFNNLFLGNRIDKTYYYKVINGCYVIVLASEDPDAQTFILNTEQYNWLEGVLKEAKAANAPTIVLNHFPIRYLQGTYNGTQLAELLKAYNVDLFLHGHIHDDLGADNFYNWGGINCVNLPRATETTHYAPGDGIVFEVYENEILVRGRDFIKGEWIDGLEYTYAITR